MTQPAKFYTPYEVAAILSCSPEHVFEWLRVGKLRKVYIGHLLRIPASALDELVEASA